MTFDSSQCGENWARVCQGCGSDRAVPLGGGLWSCGRGRRVERPHPPRFTAMLQMVSSTPRLVPNVSPLPLLHPPLHPLLLLHLPSIPTCGRIRSDLDGKCLPVAGGGRVRSVGGFIGSAVERADDRPLVAGVCHISRHDCQVVVLLVQVRCKFWRG